MRNKLPAFFLVAAIALGLGCHDSDTMTGPTQPLPVVEFIDDNPTHAGSVLIFEGTDFDETASFTLREGGEVRATLVQPVRGVGGTPARRVQVNVTIPAGTPTGSYQGCVTTSAGTGCYTVPVGVI